VDAGSAEDEVRPNGQIDEGDDAREKEVDLVLMPHGSGDRDGWDGEIGREEQQAEAREEPGGAAEPSTPRTSGLAIVWSSEMVCGREHATPAYEKRGEI
jgi:hypothetical protein